MRKIKTIVLLMAIAIGAQADVTIDYSHFPDDQFRKYVTQRYDTNDDGVLSTREAALAVTIDLSETIAKNLKGIEYFKNLTKLDISESLVRSLDVSGNEELTYLNCTHSYISKLDLSHNEKLTELYCSKTYINGLDLRNNRYLQKLDCSNCYLDYLIISGDSRDLSMVNCSSNSMTEAALELFISYLRVKTDGQLYVVQDVNTEYDYTMRDSNEFTKKLAAMVFAKGWTPYKGTYDENTGKSSWVAYTNDNYNYKADVNEDGTVDSADIVAVIKGMK